MLCGVKISWFNRIIIGMAHDNKQVANIIMAEICGEAV